MTLVEIGGYAGKFLRLDLTAERLWNESFDEETLRKYVGGTGIGTKILYEEVPAQSCWSDSVNRLIMFSGPLGGTRFPGSGTISLVTKGALTNGATSVQANGLLGAYLKFSGYDGIIVHGAAKRWLYLLIDDDGARLDDANHLLGKDTYETSDLIKKSLGRREKQMSVLSIGPAGENLVRFAGVFVDKGHSASHNGPGAVMGSKKLKAIAVSRGRKRVPVKDIKRLKTTINKFYGLWGPPKGTVGIVYNRLTLDSSPGELPIKNYLTNVWRIPKDKASKFNVEYIMKHLKPKKNPCWACQATHSTMMTITEGPYSGMEIEEPEYEQMAAWGPVIDNKDAVSAMMLSSICDRLGFENNEAGWVIAWVMECYEKGFLTKKDTNGLEMKWGSVEAVRKLLHMIAHKQGFGSKLAEGVMRASREIGGKAAEIAIYTRKGNTPRGHDHRTLWAEMFDTVVSNTGTIETSRVLMSPKEQRPGNPIETAKVVASTKGVMEFDDSLGTCRFNTRMDIAFGAEAVSATTGWDFTPAEAKNVGLRAVNLMKAFNIRAGIGKDLDYPSARYSSTPTDGPTKGISIMPDWERMLEDYYVFMGWDAKTGKPLPKTLRQLDLEHIIDDLW